MDAQLYRPIRPSSTPISAQSALKQKACFPCKTRKVKCDRKSPCNNCMSWKADCVFPSPIRRCHRPSKAAKSKTDFVGAKGNQQEALSERIQRLETHLRQLSFLTGHQQTSPASAVDLTNGEQPNIHSQLTKLEHRMNDVASYLLPDGLRYSNSGCNNQSTSQRSSLRLVNHEDDVRSLYLSRFQTGILWQQFLAMADQRAKIIHRPQAQGLLWQACTHERALNATEQALVFAIYFAAFVVMPKERVEASFHVSKQGAVKFCRGAAEKALMEANFLSGQTLPILQAMTLLAAFSEYVEGDNSAWPLVGMARRISMTSQSSAGTIFETEMRRRICWGLWYIDYRTTINYGLEGEFDMVMQMSELPANVFDEDLRPDIVSMPPTRDCWTPVSFSLLNFIIARTALDVERTNCWKTKKALIDQCAQSVHTTFLRHCTGSEPIHWLAQHVAHVHFTELRMKLHNQIQQQIAPFESDSLDRNRLVLDVTDILDVPNRLKNEPQARDWTWTLTSFPHFTHLSFLLNEISQLQIRPPPSQLWTIAEQAFARAESAISASAKSKQVLRVAMSKAEVSINILLELQRVAEDADTKVRTASRGEGLPSTDKLCHDTDFGFDFTFPDFSLMGATTASLQPDISALINDPSPFLTPGWMSHVPDLDFGVLSGDQYAFYP